jgi:hypothetical protein
MHKLIPAIAINLYPDLCLWAYRISGYVLLNLLEDPALLALAFA